ncbi:hypothetical protein DBR45_26790 [Pseudomonas sp. HMWF031]|nr:hypothetical protein DBR45_26790 [Pseudomonas sp. HMWF031]
MLPLGCAAAPTSAIVFFQNVQGRWITTAMRPNGSKLPHHRTYVFIKTSDALRQSPPAASRQSD